MLDPMRRILILALGLLPLASRADAPVVAATDAPERVLRWAVDWGPASLAEITAEIRRDGDAMEIAGVVETRGLGAWFGGFRAEQRARRGPAGPESFLTHVDDDGEQVSRRVTWTDGAPRTEVLIPPKEEKARTPIPAGALAEAVDPLSPLLEAMARIEAGEGCALRRTVYTGTSAFRVILTDAGRERLEADRTWTWGGEALRCRMRIERIGGFPLEPGRWRAEESEVTRDIWFGDVAGMATPVRMLVSWPLGYATGRIDLR